MKILGIILTLAVVAAFLFVGFQPDWKTVGMVGLTATPLVVVAAYEFFKLNNECECIAEQANNVVDDYNDLLDHHNELESKLYSGIAIPIGESLAKVMKERLTQPAPGGEGGGKGANTQGCCGKRQPVADPDRPPVDRTVDHA